MNTIYKRPSSEVNCFNCNIIFSKENRAITKTIKSNGKHLCSSSCVAVYANSIRFKNKTIMINLYTSAKKRAKSKKMNFDLTEEFLLNMFISQNKKCKLSNIIMEIPKYTENKKLTQVSIDRIKNNKGYTKDNIQLVALGINYMRNTVTTEEASNFITLLRV